MIAIGAAGLAGWAIGSRLLFAPKRTARLVATASGLFTVYAATILFVSDAFWVAVVGYLPAASLLFAGFLRAAVRDRVQWARVGASGIALTFVAAAVQQLRIAIHPVFFNHNALYHLVQAIALALVFVACRGLLAPTGGLNVDTA
jgi:hypothetical protein